MKKRNLYSFALPLACIPLALVLWIAAQLKGTAYGFWYELLYNRGPLQFLIVLISFYVGVMALLADRQNDRRTALIVGLFAFALFPIILGLLGTIAGIASVFFGYATVLESHPAAQQLFEAQRNNMIGIAVSLDSIYLGILTTMWTFPAIFRLCWKGAATSTEPEPAGGAYVAPAAGAPSAHP